MEQILTLVCKLQPSEKQVVKIEATLKAFADACNHANQIVKPQITSKTTIQNLVYKDLRSLFGLSANLAVRACARVGANRKTAKTKGKPVKAFKPTSADYDARIFTFREKDWSASLTLNGGREHIKLQVSNYQIGKLSGKSPTSAQLCKHRDGLYYLHIQLTDVAPEPIRFNKVIGVDLGRRDIAVTNHGDRWDGKQIKETRDKFSRVRASLQRKGTKGRLVCGGIIPPQKAFAKRALKRLSGRERRYQAWLNHTISKSIIADAKTRNAIVAIEDLTGIRERTNTKPRSKTERRRSNSWSFHQLRTFLEYKGIKSGVEVIAIPPAWTSQTCHQCLHIGARSNCKPEATSGFACERSDKVFKCGNCSWHGDADLNAANVISLLGGSVSGLVRSVLACSSSEPQARAKAPSL